jgi:hypothetical protein
MIRVLGGSAAFFVLASCLVADELRTLSAKTITGTLEAISDKEVTLKTEAGPVTTPLAQVLALDVRPVKGIPAGVKYTDVRLLDDTTLHCQAVDFQGKKVELTLLSGTKLQLPVNFLAWMVHEAQNPELRKRFDDLLVQKARRDRIVIKRDQELSALEGTLGEADAKGTTIQFKHDAGTSPIFFERLHGLIFYRTELAPATPLCRVYDADGNMLIATHVTLGGPDDVVVTTGFGAKVTLKRESLAKLDFNLGKLTYLSDLEPKKVVERSGAGLVTHYRKDANLDGEPIILDKQYPKGLSLHAHTELTYELGGKYQDFKARLGVDARTGVDSQAFVTIYCDGEKRFAETVSAKAQKDIALNVKDVGTLRIVVSSRNFLDLHDHATLAEARVSQ